MENQHKYGHGTHESEKLISIKVEVPNSSLATSIMEMISVSTHLSPDCCIFRVPVTVRQTNEKAYDPLLVSIGPFHHGKEELKSMENRKPAYLKAFLARCSDHIDLETCIDMIREWEQRIRDCYEETFEFSSDEFVKMILLDSCFVIEILWKYYEVNQLKGVSDRISHRSMVGDVLVDIILLENQLPFFVLQALFKLTNLKPIDSNEYYFTYLCINYFNSTILNGDRLLAMENISHQKQPEIKHLLDLLRMCQVPSIPRQIPKNNHLQGDSMCKATELEEAGMVIRTNLNHRSAADICYTTGFLEIPKIVMHNLSERVLRNLIALERFLYYQDSYISDYVHFLDKLIDSSKDADLLIRKGVIQCFSSDSQQVATIINNLRPRISTINYFYSGIEEQVIAYCKCPKHKWRATLRRDYCSSPWIIASTIAAIVLLILTFIQTVISIVPTL